MYGEAKARTAAAEGKPTVRKPARDQGRGVLARSHTWKTRSQSI